jgi:hypothetical protein
MATLQERLREPHGHSENEVTGEVTLLYDALRLKAADALDAAEKALEWYSTASEDGEWVFGEWRNNLVLDGGKRARAALSRLRDSTREKDRV